MEINQYTERYKAKSNSELIRIIRNSSDYQELAIDTAKTELAQRGVSESEINQIENNSAVETNYIPSPIFKKIKSWFKSYTFEDYTILGISILLAIISFMGLYISYTILKYTPLDIESADFSTFIFLLMMILPTTTTVLFWKRDKLGWILAAILFTYSLLDALYKFYNPYNFFSDKEVLFGLRDSIFLVVLLYLICKSKIRAIYRINNNIMIHTIGWTIALAIIIYILLTN